MKQRYFKYIIIVIALLVSAQSAFAQKEKAKEVSVYGTVKNEQGVPLMGVQVSIQDSFIDTETDEMGYFEITAPSAGSVIVFRADAYLEFVYPVKDDEFIDVVLKEAPIGQGINDGVQMPWGLTQRRNLTSNVPTVGNDVLSQSPVMSLGNALSGRLPGLIIKQVAGRPGYDEATLRIRGSRTLVDGATNGMTVYGVATPLIIVDGFERNFAELDASEIESFSVLKDAASTALYGMRGANGVVLVTTKRGITNKRTIDFKVSSGIVAPTRLPEFVDSYNYASLYNEARRNDGLSPMYTEEDLELYRTGASPLTHPNVDYYDEFLKDFTMQKQASLSMRGGNKLVRYFVVLAYNSQDGLLDKTGENPDFRTKLSYNKYNLRSNVDVNLTDWLVFSGDVSGRIEDRRYPYTDMADILSSFMTPSNAYPISFKGIDPVLNQEILMLGGNSLYKNNPLGYLSYSGYNESTRRYYQATAKMKADLSKFITKGLSLEGSFYLDGYNAYRVEKSRTFSVWEYSKANDGSDKYTQFGQESSLTSSGYYEVDRYNGLDLSLKYNRAFGKHAVNGMVFYARQSREYRQANISDKKYENLAFWANYTYDNKYFLDISGSYMGSDKFYDTKNRKLFYPAVGASWVVSQENFMKGSKSWLDYLKLNVSYGITGNDQYTVKDINDNEERYPGRVRWWTYSSQQYFGTALTSVVFVKEGRFSNPNVTTEKARMLNIGLESYMFNHRLTFTGDVWKEHRTDAFTVGLGSTPWVIGLLDSRLPIGNEGVIDSYGFEASLKWADKIGDFSYSVGGYVDWNDTKIVNMAEPYREYENLVQTGKRTLQSFGLISLGLFKDWDDINSSPAQTFGSYQPGDIKYKDVNGDNIIDSNDIVPLGDGYFPRLNCALDINLQYKGFYVSALFQGVGLRHAYLSSGSMKAFADNHNAGAVALGRFRTFEDGTTNHATATYPRLTTLANDNNYRASSYWFYDASFIRLKNAEIGYNVSDKALKGTNVSGIRIFLNAYNAFTLTKLPYFDPEDVSAGSSRYPQIKIYNLGVNLTF